MSAVPLLDTHAWIWWMNRDPRLQGRITAELDAFGPDSRPYLADISLWEVAMLVDKGRLDLRPSVGDWLETASHSRTVRIVPISAAIAAETRAARVLRDPADRIIVATSRVLDVPLFTHDGHIIRSKLAPRWIPPR